MPLSGHHQQHFDKIQNRFITPSVLYLPIAGGCYILYSDTSYTQKGSSLW